MSLRAVFFDIDDTLFSTSEFAARARRNACQAMHDRGLNLPVDSIYRELLEVIAEFTSNYDHHFDKLILRLPRRAVAGVHPAVLVAAGVAAYHDTKRDLRAFPDALDVLSRLARTPLLRGIITSGLAAKQAEKLLLLGVYEHLTPTAIFISDSIGISKPNPKLFLRACEECSLNPADAMYVGNDPAKDIDPANQAGMISVLVARGAPPGGGQTAPAHALRSLSELIPLLRDRCGIEVPV